MKHLKQYASVDEYINNASIANENKPELDLFADAVAILQQMKNVAATNNVVDFNGTDVNSITSDEYDELIQWLESLEKTKH
jgi:hypothetical protein